jgi:hypothetical protein
MPERFAFNIYHFLHPSPEYCYTCPIRFSKLQLRCKTHHTLPLNSDYRGLGSSSCISNGLWKSVASSSLTPQQCVTKYVDHGYPPPRHNRAHSTIRGGCLQLTHTSVQGHSLRNGHCLVNLNRLNLTSFIAYERDMTCRQRQACQADVVTFPKDSRTVMYYTLFFVFP